MEDWTDWQTWWMDLAKTSIVGVVGFFLAYFLVDKLKQSKTEQRTLCARLVAEMQDALNEFDRAGSAYRRATKEAFIELYRWRDEQPTEPIRLWWGPAYNNYSAAIRNVSLRFGFDGDLTATLTKIEVAMVELFTIVDTKIDVRLDEIEGFWERYQGDPTKRTSDSDYIRSMQPINRSDLNDDRPQLEDQLVALKDAHKKAIETMDKILAMPESRVCELRLQANGRGKSVSA